MGHIDKDHAFVGGHGANSPCPARCMSGMRAHTPYAWQVLSSLLHHTCQEDDTHINKPNCMRQEIGTHTSKAKMHARMHG